MDRDKIKYLNHQINFYLNMLKELNKKADSNSKKILKPA